MQLRSIVELDNGPFKSRRWLVVLVGCCNDDDHDYCCRCAEGDERVEWIIRDVLTGEYDGEVDLPSRLLLQFEAASILTGAIIAVLNHEDVL